jgi:hypothetical protein
MYNAENEDFEGVLFDFAWKDVLQYQLMDQ